MARVTKRRAKKIADDEELTFQEVIYKRLAIKQYFKGGDREITSSSLVNRALRWFLTNQGKLHRSPEERKTTWLELFFDLIYVAIVADLGHHFSADPSWSRLSYFFLLFGPVFRTW